MDSEEMEKKFNEYLANPTSGSNIIDLELRKIASMLGLGVLRLDASSTRLARVNIRLTVANVFFSFALLAVGVIQIVLMFRGH